MRVPFIWRSSLAVDERHNRSNEHSNLNENYFIPIESVHCGVLCLVFMYCTYLMLLVGFFEL